MRVTEQQTFSILANNLERSRARALEILAFEEQARTRQPVQGLAR